MGECGCEITCTCDEIEKIIQRKYDEDLRSLAYHLVTYVDGSKRKFLVLGLNHGWQWIHVFITNKFVSWALKNHAKIIKLPLFESRLLANPIDLAVIRPYPNRRHVPTTIIVVTILVLCFVLQVTYNGWMVDLTCDLKSELSF